MSWFASIFTFPAPHDAQKRVTATTTTPPHEKRILEEPIETSIAGTQSSQSRASRTSDLSTSTSIQDQTRPNRNKVILGAGLGFLALSTLITRRSFARRKLASQAAFYKDAPGHNAEQSAQVSGAMEAVEALNVATINVLSLAMIGIGGSLWYWDINSLDDARRLVRGGLGVDGSGRSEADAEEEFEEWLATTLSRKDAKSAKLAMQEGKER